MRNVVSSCLTFPGKKELGGKAWIKIYHSENFLLDLKYVILFHHSMTGIISLYFADTLEIKPVLNCCTISL